MNKSRESKNPGRGVDVDYTDVAREIGGVHMTESDSKFNEEVFEFSGAWREHEEELCCDAISGEAMIKELVDASRKVEMETFKKHGVCEKVPIEEWWKNARRAAVGVKRADTSKGGKENREYRCRLVAKEIKKDKREDLFAAMPPIEAKKMLFSLWASSITGRCSELSET